MKIFLKKIMLPLFLTAGGDWAPQGEETKTFRSGTQAAEYSRTHHLSGTEILYHFDNPRFDFTIKVSDAPAD